MSAAIALAGETIDALVWRVMGSIPGAVESTINLNPALVSDVILPEGTSVTLPDMGPTASPSTRAPQTLETIKLWD